VAGWGGGRTASVRARHSGGHDDGYTAFTRDRVWQARLDPSDIYRPLLQAILSGFSDGAWPVAPEERVEVVAFQEAYLHSQRAGDPRVALRAL